MSPPPKPPPPSSGAGSTAEPLPPPEEDDPAPCVPVDPISCVVSVIDIVLEAKLWLSLRLAGP